MGNPDSEVKMPEFNILPEVERGLDVDKGMKQVLAVLTAYWREKRVALRASDNGILFTTSPQIIDIIHVAGSGANDTYQGPDCACSEVMVIGHPSNGDTIWVRTHKTATVDNAWPLLKYHVLNFSITNLNLLHILIETDTERAIIAYTM